MNITINIHIDAGDIATLGPKLAAIARGLALLQAPEPPERAPLHETPVLAPETPASGETSEIAAIPQPTQSAAMAVDPPRKASGDRLAFEQFDSLVRSVRAWPSMPTERTPSAPMAAPLSRWGRRYDDDHYR